jgi:hypothetical protein
MKTTQLLSFIIPISLIAAGFVIGGRDGGIFSIIGSVALLVVSFWQAIKIGRQMGNDQPPKNN